SIFLYIIPLFFFNDTATTEIYTLSLHDALPISRGVRRHPPPFRGEGRGAGRAGGRRLRPSPRGDPRHAARRTRGFPARAARSVADRKSTRLNSSHVAISYAVFCLKKKKKTTWNV